MNVKIELKRSIRLICMTSLIIASALFLQGISAYADESDTPTIENTVTEAAIEETGENSEVAEESETVTEEENPSDDVEDMATEENSLVEEGAEGELLGTADGDGIDYDLITGNQADDIIYVASTQIGYAEGSNGYTKYGAWYNTINSSYDFSCSDWCAMFVSWCATKAGIGSDIANITALADRSYWRDRGIYQDSVACGGSYTPKKGDWIFFNWGYDPGMTHHVGLVESVENGWITTIEGNSNSDNVKRKVYSVACTYILGYGTPWYKTASGTWIENSEGNVERYQYENGNYARNTFMERDNEYYYFDSNGYAVHGEQVIDGQEYYFDEVTGARFSGLREIDEATTYGYNLDGVKLYGSDICIGDVWLYFDSETGNLQETDPLINIAEGDYNIESRICDYKVIAIENNSTDKGACVELYDMTGDSSQMFTLEYVGDGYYAIINKESGYVLDVYRSVPDACAKLWQYTANNTAAQRWKFISSGDGYYYIVSELGTYIDVNGGEMANGTDLWTYTFNGTNAQRWRLVTDVDERLSDYSKLTKRLSGDDRYETALEIADEYKKNLGVESFETIVVACGSNFPDALSGGYLAKINNAPIILVGTDNEEEIFNYIKNNLNSDGKVYILGSEVSVSANFEELVSAYYTTTRLGGADRYETNLLILEKCGTDFEDLLVCTGEVYADSLSAAATGRPIMLVSGDSLTQSQMEFLRKLNVATDYYCIGSAIRVSENIKNQIASILTSGTGTRIAGADRYETSVKIAETFFNNDVTTITLAVGNNFPDGLAGGPLAIYLGTPIILVSEDNTSLAMAYRKEKGIKYSIALGGANVLSDTAVRKVMSGNEQSA